GEVARAHLGIVELDRNQDLVREEPPAGIVLAEHFAEDFVIGKFAVLEAVGERAGELAAADRQDLDLDEAALAVEAEDVLVDAEMRDHLLRLGGFLERADLVAEARRLLEAELVRGLLHA